MSSGPGTHASTTSAFVHAQVTSRQRLTDAQRAFVHALARMGTVAGGGRDGGAEAVDHWLHTPTPSDTGPSGAAHEPAHAHAHAHTHAHEHTRVHEHVHGGQPPPSSLHRAGGWVAAATGDGGGGGVSLRAGLQDADREALSGIDAAVRFIDARLEQLGAGAAAEAAAEDDRDQEWVSDLQTLRGAWLLLCVWVECMAVCVREGGGTGARAPSGTVLSRLGTIQWSGSFISFASLRPSLPVFCPYPEFLVRLAGDVARRLQRLTMDRHRVAARLRDAVRALRQQRAQGVGGSSGGGGGGGGGGEGVGGGGAWGDFQAAPGPPAPTGPLPAWGSAAERQGPWMTAEVPPKVRLYPAGPGLPHALVLRGRR
jgi:hypothetical protein